MAPMDNAPREQPIARPRTAKLKHRPKSIILCAQLLIHDLKLSSSTELTLELLPLFAERVEFKVTAEELTELIPSPPCRSL